MDASRRGFLFGRRKSAVVSPPLPLRPPWALAEPEFLAACSRCGKCAEKCPTRIVVVGSGGFPQVDFSVGECTFCGGCAAVCADGALRRDNSDDAGVPWHLLPQIEDSCIARLNVVCRSCGDSCETQAIRFRPRLGGAALPEIEASACTGCGACVAVCPPRAISMKRVEENEQGAGQ